MRIPRPDAALISKQVECITVSKSATVCLCLLLIGKVKESTTLRHAEHSSFIHSFHSDDASFSAHCTADGERSIMRIPDPGWRLADGRPAGPRPFVLLRGIDAKLVRCIGFHAHRRSSIPRLAANFGSSSSLWRWEVLERLTMSAAESVSFRQCGQRRKG